MKKAYAAALVVEAGPVVRETMGFPTGEAEPVSFWAIAGRGRG